MSRLIVPVLALIGAGAVGVWVYNKWINPGE